MTLANERWSQSNFPLTPCNCGLLHWNAANSEPTESKQRAIWIALGLLCGLFVTELSLSVWSRSLSLLADAGHMLADIAVLALTLAAAGLAQRPARGRATFGYGRVEILVALINGLSLIGVALFVITEALDRLSSPTAVLGLPMLLGAALGLGVNSINLGLLYRSSRHQGSRHESGRRDLNFQSAFLHVAADAASSIGLVCASLLIHFCQWMWMDAAISVVIAVVTGLAALPLIQESVEVLLELAPRSLDPDAVKAAIEQFAWVDRVDTLHIWRLNSNQVMLTAHLSVAALSANQRDSLVQQIQAHLQQTFGIHAATLQLLDRSSVRQIHPLLHRSLTDYVFTKT